MVGGWVGEAFGVPTKGRGSGWTGLGRAATGGPRMELPGEVVNGGLVGMCCGCLREGSETDGGLGRHGWAVWVGLEPGGRGCGRS